MNELQLRIEADGMPPMFQGNFQRSTRPGKWIEDDAPRRARRENSRFDQIVGKRGAVTCLSRSDIDRDNVARSRLGLADVGVGGRSTS